MTKVLTSMEVLWGVSDGQRQLILQRLKYADRINVGSEGEGAVQDDALTPDLGTVVLSMFSGKLK